MYYERSWNRGLVSFKSQDAGLYVPWNQGCSMINEDECIQVLRYFVFQVTVLKLSFVNKVKDIAEFLQNCMLWEQRKAFEEFWSHSFPNFSPPILS